MSERCACGRPLLARPGDIEATCAECQAKPSHCTCLPLRSNTSSNTSHTSDRAGKHRLTSVSNTSHTSNTEMRQHLIAGVRDGAWLDQQHFEPLQFAVGELLPEGFTLLVGPPKAGKSWLALALLLGVASGGLALKRIKIDESRPVLYLALEDGDRRMQERCRTLLGDDDIPANYNYLLRIEPGMLMPTIEAWMDSHPDTALIVIDTLGRILPAARQGESAYQRDYAVGAALKRITDGHPGLALLALHHDRKAGAEDFVDTVSGTHGLAGAADTIVVLCRERGTDRGTLKITGRDVPEDEYAIDLNHGMSWELAADTLEAAAAEAARRAGLQREARRSATTNDICDFVLHTPPVVTSAEAVAKFGPKAYEYLRRLLNDGLIDSPGRGRWCPPPSHQCEKCENR